MESRRRAGRSRDATQPHGLKTGRSAQQASSGRAFRGLTKKRNTWGSRFRVSPDPPGATTGVRIKRTGGWLSVIELVSAVASAARQRPLIGLGGCHGQ